MLFPKLFIKIHKPIRLQWFYKKELVCDGNAPTSITSPVEKHAESIVTNCSAEA